MFSYLARFGLYRCAFCRRAVVDSDGLWVGVDMQTACEARVDVYGIFGAHVVGVC